MKYVKLGKTNIDVSVIALGCWAFGGGGYWGNRENDEISLRTIDTALDAGINFFDTAEVYGDGHSDRVLGRAMKNRRDKFVVATKVYLDKMRKPDLIVSCEESLKRMETDYIDLFYPHFASKEVTFEETFEAFELLKVQGKIRGIGLSNFGVKALTRLDEAGMLSKIELHQLPYSLLWRTIEYGIAQQTSAYDIGIICYSTLAQGLLSGLYDKIEDVPDNLKSTRHYNAKHINAGHGEEGCEEDVFEAVRNLKRICKEAGIGLAPASLAWLYTRPGVRCILSGPENPAQLLENIAVLEINLPAEVAGKMTAATEKVKEKLGENSDMWFSGEQSRVF